MWMRNSLLLSYMALCLAGGLAGCDSASDDAAGSSAAAGGGAVAAGDSAQARLTKTMVTAVSAGEGTGPVDVRFELLQRPEVDQPAEIAFALIPTAPLDRVFARFSPEAGLELVRGGETQQIARPVVGAAITHTLVVRPKKNGIFNVQVTVLMDSRTESISRVYSVPLIAGSGIAELEPRKVAARADDPG